MALPNMFPNAGCSRLQEDLGDGFDVRSLGLTFHEGHVLGKHAHSWAQLVYAKTGLMHVEVRNRIYFVPPTKALWIPPKVTHRITFAGDVEMRTLYVSSQRARLQRNGVVTLEVQPLLSHLIQYIQTIKMLDPGLPEHDHLASVLMDLIVGSPTLDLSLPLPLDDRAIRLADLLRSNPCDKRRLSVLAALVGASLRTMQRHFVGETGLTLDVWRQKARLIHSVASLSAGASVTTAAMECGYESASAYIAAFKRQYGVTPGRFVAVA